jgi:hypothetical protein
MELTELKALMAASLLSVVSVDEANNPAEEARKAIATSVKLAQEIWEEVLRQEQQ